MKCPGCTTEVQWPSEVLRGTVIGICPHCGFKKGLDDLPRPKPDMRGRPTKPGPVSA